MNLSSIPGAFVGWRGILSVVAEASGLRPRSEQMSQQAPAVIPVHLEGPVEVLHPPMLETPHPPDAGTPTPEEVRATEAVFAHDQQEHALVHGLLGMWAG